MSETQRLKLPIPEKSRLMNSEYFSDLVGKIEMNAASKVDVENLQNESNNDWFVVLTQPTANRYVGTITGVPGKPAPTGYKLNMKLTIRIPSANTGSVVININGWGDKLVKRSNDSTLSAGNMKPGVSRVVYDGTDFILAGEGGSGTAQPHHVMSGETFTNDSGESVGTMVVNGTKTINGTWTNTTSSTTVEASAGIPEGFYYEGTTIKIRLTDAQLISKNLKKGTKVFNVTGDDNVVDTADATAAAADMIDGRVSYVRGVRVVGTMIIQGAVSKAGTWKNTSASTTVESTAIIPGGYYPDGTTVKALLSDANLISKNIKAGSKVFNVSGDPNVVDTSDATATPSDVLAGKTVYIKGVKVTGELPDLGEGTIGIVTGSIVATDDTGGIWIQPKRTGKINYNLKLQLRVPNLRPVNIKKGITIGNDGGGGAGITGILEAQVPADFAVGVNGAITINVPGGNVGERFNGPERNLFNIAAGASLVHFSNHTYNSSSHLPISFFLIRENVVGEVVIRDSAGRSVILFSISSTNNTYIHEFTIDFTNRVITKKLHAHNGNYQTITEVIPEERLGDLDRSSPLSVVFTPWAYRQPGPYNTTTTLYLFGRVKHC